MIWTKLLNLAKNYAIILQKLKGVFYILEENWKSSDICFLVIKIYHAISKVKETKKTDTNEQN